MYTLETDVEVWKGVIGRRGNADVNNRRSLLQLCCNDAMCIMNICFQHSDLHRYTWCRDSLCQWSLIDFCTVSTDLFHSVLEQCVKRDAELSTDHYLVAFNLRLENQLGLLHKCAGRGNPTIQIMKHWRKKTYKKDLCRQRDVLVPRAPELHSGRACRVAAVESSCSFICCSDMRTETTWCGDKWQKGNLLVEPRVARCFSSKESCLQGIDSEQNRIFFAFALS